jgi:hypothetical protein
MSQEPEHKSHNLTYSTAKEDIALPEYGRYVQELVQHAKTITDVAQQQKTVEHIVTIILQLQPQIRSIEEYREKLWKHVYHMAGYELTALPPSQEPPLRPEDMPKAPVMPYPKYNAKFRHYGHHVVALIEKAKALEDGPVRNGMIYAIGSYMKLAYKTWNKDHYSGDDTIREELLAMSNGVLDLSALPQEIESQAIAQRSRRQVHPDQPDLLSPSQRRRFYQQQFGSGRPQTQRSNKRRR